VAEQPLVSIYVFSSHLLCSTRSQTTQHLRAPEGTIRKPFAARCSSESHTQVSKRSNQSHNKNYLGSCARANYASQMAHALAIEAHTESEDKESDI
jgi:hypothetical protein